MNPLLRCTLNTTHCVMSEIRQNEPTLLLIFLSLNVQPNLETEKLAK